MGNIVGINLAFVRSSMCLVLFSSDGRDGPAPRAVSEDAFTVLMDESCTPTNNPLSDMTPIVISSRSTYVIDSSSVLSSSDIFTQD